MKAVRDIARLGPRRASRCRRTPELRNGCRLTALVFDRDDLKAWKNRREGNHDVQLPTASIEAFRDCNDWSRPDFEVLLQLLRSYQNGRNQALAR
jgi:hypothetical protein